MLCAWWPPSTLPGWPRRALSALPAPGCRGGLPLPGAARRACLDGRLPTPASRATRRAKPPLLVYHCPGLSTSDCLEHQRRPGRRDRHGLGRRHRRLRGGPLTRSRPVRTSGSVIQIWREQQHSLQNRLLQAAERKCRQTTIGHRSEPHGGGARTTKSMFANVRWRIGDDDTHFSDNGGRQSATTRASADGGSGRTM